MSMWSRRPRPRRSCSTRASPTSDPGWPSGSGPEPGSPVSHVVLTHGHRDHAGGAAALVDGLADVGGYAPCSWATRRCRTGWPGYRLTDGYNQVVNQRQFGRVPNWDLVEGWAFEVPELDVSFDRRTTVDVGGLGGRVASCAGRDRRPSVGVDRGSCRGGDRGPDAVALPQRRQSSQGTALPARVGRRAARHRRRRPGAAAARSRACPSPVGERIRRVLLDTAAVLEELTMMALDLMNRGAKPR